MDNRYDVIVVGAGNAGLAAAATTAKNGLKTLLIEKNILPGGCATSFRRGRFEFEASLHELANVGAEENSGSIRNFFESLGANVNWHTEKTAFRVVSGGEDGCDAVLPSGIGDFCDEMERLVPNSRESVLKVFEIAKKINVALAYLSKGKPDPAVMLSEHADFMRAASHSVDECLDALNMPKKAQNILKTYWPYLGARTDEMDFAHYTVLLERYINVYPAVPEKRSHELSLALEKVIRENGGEIRYRTEAKKILFDKNRACGIDTGKEQIYAKHLVMNCFPETAYKMTDRKNIPEKAVSLANAREYGSLFFTVYLGLDATAEELGIEDYTVFLFDSPDSTEQFFSTESSDTCFVIANCLNKIVPDASPKGTSMLFLTAILTERAWKDVRPEKYKKTKNKIADRIISVYETKTGIKIRENIEEIAVAAPPTFARYLNTPCGTPYGYRLKPWDTMISRIMSLKNELFIPGISFVGAHAERSDGYSSTYANGRSAAERILRKEQQNGGK